MVTWRYFVFKEIYGIHPLRLGLYVWNFDFTMEQTVIQPKTRHCHPPAVRLRCRADYVNGEATLPQLSNKYTVPLATVRDWCFTGKWSAAREKRLAGMLESEPPTFMEPANDEDLSASTHARAREYAKHLVRLRTQLEGEDDPQKIDRLCSGIAKLEDVYCRYAGIPLPGSRRPGKERAKPENSVIEPL